MEKPIGEWNALRIRCSAGEVVVEINGVEVQRGADLTVDVGSIALQSEGAPIEFRKIRVAPIVGPRLRY